MTNEQKKAIIEYNCQYHELMLCRYNKVQKWYLAIKLYQLKTILKIKNILGLKYELWSNYLEYVRKTEKNSSGN